MGSYLNLACAFAAVLGAVIPIATHAQNAQTLLKTQSGCSIFQDAESVKVMTQDPKSSLIATWSGECLNGLAQGAGVLRTVWRHGEIGDQSSHTTTVTMRAHLGNQFGFANEEQENILPGLSFGDAPKQPLVFRNSTWLFRWGNRFIRFNGLGLEGDNTLLSHAEGAMPRRSPNVLARTGISVGDLGGIALTDTTCARELARFPECGFGEGEPNFTVYYFAQGGFKDRKKTFCPQPRELSSCVAIVAQLTEPYVAAAEALIRESMPKVREMEVAMQNAPLLAAQEKARAVKAEADAAQRLALEQAQANAAFDARLEQAPVGELFAMADEFKSKGDLTRARKALRQLMSRFPDHKLAGMAAGLLTELQGK